MPRPDKPISQGPLDEPTSPSRSQTWTKYGGAETIEGHRGTSGAEGSATVEVTVDDITVADYPDDIDSKYTTRGASPHRAVVPDDQPTAKPVRIVTEWVIDRTVEGRIYHRTDRVVKVQLDD